MNPIIVTIYESAPFLNAEGQDNERRYFYGREDADHDAAVRFGPRAATPRPVKAIEVHVDQRTTHYYLLQDPKPVQVTLEPATSAVMDEEPTAADIY